MCAAAPARTVDGMLPSPSIHRILVDAHTADLRREAARSRHRRSLRGRRSEPDASS
jgi:hypothetical protein